MKRLFELAKSSAGELFLDAGIVVPFVLFMPLTAGKKFHLIPGAHHNDAPNIGGRGYLRSFDSFVKSILTAHTNGLHAGSE